MDSVNEDWGEIDESDDVSVLIIELWLGEKEVENVDAEVGKVKTEVCSGVAVV